jgi:membrane protease YdiL (CAAX protease family)
VKRLYEKNELAFSLVWIALYIALLNVADAASDWIGVVKIITLPVLLFLSLGIDGFTRRNRLRARYGLTRAASGNAGRFLYFLPLAVIASANLWNGVTLRYSGFETVLYVGSMLCVGYIEEMIFRGFLFRAIQKRHAKAAVGISSITFGLGHIVNLLNGAAPLPTLLQIVYATSIGYLFTVVLLTSGSLVPCIVTHGVLDALSAFSTDGGAYQQIIIAVIITVVALGYALYLNRLASPEKGPASSGAA